MIFRVDELLTALPVPNNPDPAAAVQKITGGKTGELSTLLNYMIQSNRFRGRDQYRPFYDVIANIAAEEWGHVELVRATINLLPTGATTRGSNPSAAPLNNALDQRTSDHYLASGQAALPVDSMGSFWNGSFVTNTGNLKLDLVHNFFLELGARAPKAFAKALEKLTRTRTTPRTWWCPTSRCRRPPTRRRWRPSRSSPARSPRGWSRG